MKFYQGLEVRYRHHFGKINFISNSYVTLKLNNTNTDLLIYQNDWDDVYPVTGNRKEEQ